MPSFASINSTWGWYFPFRTLLTSGSGNYKSHQTCFANKEKLNTSISLNPILYFASFYTKSQLFQQMLLLLPALPHQNCLIKAIISSHNPLGSRKHFMDMWEFPTIPTELIWSILSSLLERTISPSTLLLLSKLCPWCIGRFLSLDIPPNMVGLNTSLLPSIRHLQAP